MKHVLTVVTNVNSILHHKPLLVKKEDVIMDTEKSLKKTQVEDIVKDVNLLTQDVSLTMKMKKNPPNVLLTHQVVEIMIPLYSLTLLKLLPL